MQRKKEAGWKKFERVRLQPARDAKNCGSRVATRAAGYTELYPPVTSSTSHHPIKRETTSAASVMHFNTRARNHRNESSAEAVLCFRSLIRATVRRHCHHGCAACISGSGPARWRCKGKVGCAKWLETRRTLHPCHLITIAPGQASYLVAPKCGCTEVSCAAGTNSSHARTQ